MRFDFTNGRTIVGQGVEVHVGIIENHGAKTVEVKESSCNGEGVLAVSMWPSSKLSSGQRAEVFVARVPGKIVSRRLPSLIN